MKYKHLQQKMLQPFCDFEKAQRGKTHLVNLPLKSYH